ncbi:MAG: ABC transporter permease [Acidobacteria bacterium]|nr:ABC transporter permease [Acidobacteriota bacterium]
METLWQDVRYGVRQLARSPGFTAIAVLTLALGIGANTAIFSVVNAVLLRPLPHPEPERLTMVWLDNRDEGWPEDLTSYPTYLDWRSQNRSFEDMAAFTPSEASLSGDGEPERVRSAVVSANYFSVLRVQPARGRIFRPEEEVPGAGRVVVLSAGLWQRRFAGSPDIVGQPVNLGGNPFTVIGVLPPGFEAPARTELWLPFSILPQQRLEARGSLWLYVVGRLKPDVPLAEAQAEMTAIARRLEQQYPDTMTNLGVNLVPLHTEVVGKVRPALLTILGAVVFVLLIACANVANLQLARTAARQRELAVRAAVGAGRSRLVRQLLTESLLLAMLGGVLGLLLALWGVETLRGVLPANVPRVEEISVDAGVLVFLLGATLATTLLFGLVPALRTTRLELNDSLKEGGRSATDGSHSRLRSALVVGEVALALLLLLGAGLMLRSFQNLLAVNPGFRTGNVLTFDLNTSPSKYPEPAQVSQFYEQLFGRLKGLPGVEGVGAASDVPLSGSIWPNAAGFTLEGIARSPEDLRLSVNISVVATDYFRTLGVPLVRGRFLGPEDSPESSPVLLINEAMARRYWPNQDPIGKRMKYGGGVDPTEPWRTIVGVVADVRDSELDRETRIASYLPHSQVPRRAMTLVLRSSSDPMRMAPWVREQVWSLDSTMPVANLSTMEARLERSVAQRRFNLLLLGLFGVLALTIASIGIYGVIGYSVSQRRHEIGVRMALGAQRRDIFRHVVGQGIGLALLGIGIGLAGAFALTRFITGLLFRIEPTDPATLVVVSALLAGVAFLACFMPARRAARVDPMVALRYE